MENKKQYIEEAIKLSFKGMRQGKGGPFGAVIVKDGKIIGKSCNKVLSKKDPTAHAEIIAIQKASKNIDNFNLSGSTIYTSCEPCPMCLSAIYWAKIDKIYYANSSKDAENIGFNDEFIYKELNKKMASRAIPNKQIINDKAILAFNEWEEKNDKITY